MDKLLGFILVLLGVCALVFGITIYSAFAWAVVIEIIWGWYAPAIWLAAPEITFTQALAVSVLLSLVKSTPNTKYKGLEVDANWEGVITLPWIVLLSAWIIKIVFI